MNQSKTVLVEFVKEKNDVYFKDKLQEVINRLSNEYSIEVQYSHICNKSNSNTETFYTALVIARRK